MFATRITRCKGKYEDFPYDTYEEAYRHLMTFRDDNTGDYRNISVIDNTNTVRAIMPFENGKAMPVIRDRSAVKIKKEFCAPGEEKYLFLVTNLNELTGRTDIMCVNSLMTLKPIETVGIEMIYPVTRDSEGA